MSKKTNPKPAKPAKPDAPGTDQAEGAADVALPMEVNGVVRKPQTCIEYGRRDDSNE